jgi:predicted Rossmann fold flavoprotein
MANRKPLLVVIGGGAAGFFCAVNAARLHPHIKVVILEKSKHLLSKVKISGGGRCNVTHHCDSIAEMSKRYPRGEKLVKKTFHQFFTKDTVTWFAERGVPIKVEADGRMFPATNESQSIIDCLLREAQQYGVTIQRGAGVTALEKIDQNFRISIQGTKTLLAQWVVIACGGYPKSNMFDWITSTGHAISNPVPSLFTCNIPKHPITELMGLSVAEAQVKILGTKFKEQGPLLITHWGLSGPVILRLSAWGARYLQEQQWQYTIQINWLPHYHEASLKDAMLQHRQVQGASKVGGKNAWGLPLRIWNFMLAQSEISLESRWADMPAKGLNKLVKNLCAYEMEVKGKTTYKEEFVTAGGVMLDQIDHHTLMSKKVPNLFFAGEILDVDGITGGYNFQHAWTSGYIVALHIQ